MKHPTARSGLLHLSLAVALLLGGCAGGRPLLTDGETGRLEGWAWSPGSISPSGSRSITIRDCGLPHPRCTSVEARITVRQGDQEEGYPATLTSEGFEALLMRKIRKMKREVEIAVEITAVEGQDYCDPYLQGAAWTYSGKLEETGRRQYSVSFTQFKASSPAEDDEGREGLAPILTPDSRGMNPDLERSRHPRQREEPPITSGGNHETAPRRVGP